MDIDAAGKAVLRESRQALDQSGIHFWIEHQGASGSIATDRRATRNTKFLANRHSRLEAVRKELRDSLRLLSERRAALITAAVTGQIPLETMRA